MNAPTLPLRLTVSGQPVRDPALRFEVTARFTNVSREHVRLLSQFEPLPVFFTTTLQAESGREIDVAGAGKADFAAGALREKDLAPGEAFDVALNLAPWIRGAVPPGRYQLTLTYHNAYGSGCFHGPLTSVPAAIEVTGAV
jgi:hypothetical protein